MLEAKVRAQAYTAGMSRDVIPVESGRLVLLPRRRMPDTPMAGNCLMLPIPAGRLFVTPWYVKVVGHPGTSALRRLTVTLKATAEQSHVLFAHAPSMVVGDHSFIFTRVRDALCEGGRALRACEGSRRIGSFRADSSDVGVCLRTGFASPSYLLTPVDGGFALEWVQPQEEEQDEAAGIT